MPRTSAAKIANAALCELGLLGAELEKSDRSPGGTNAGALSAQPMLIQRRQEILARSLKLVAKPGIVALSMKHGQLPLDVIESHRIELRYLRTLSLHWAHEADSAARAGDFRTAVDFDVAQLRLGNALSRGGLPIHCRGAISVKSLGLNHLARIRGQLSPDLLLAVKPELESLDGHDDPQVTMARHDHWYENASTWKLRLMIQVEKWLGRQPSRSSASYLREPLDYEAMRRRLLLTELALTLFHHQHQRYPNSLAEMAPSLLATAPVDPYTDKPLVYRKSESGFVLYSAGADREDNGGVIQTKRGQFRFGHDWDLASTIDSPESLEALTSHIQKFEPPPVLTDRH